MQYITRNCEKLVKKLEKMYGAILITGPRRTGKTTFCKNHKQKLSLLNFDDFTLRESVNTSPNNFFLENKLPLILDEIQRVPKIFLQIKYELDKTDKKGQVFMTGSQAFSLMKNISESLAGRIGIVTLLGLSQKEKYGIDFYDPFLPTDSYIKKCKDIHINYDEIWQQILLGGMPELFENSEAIDRKLYWSNYISTYIERDVREISNIVDTTKFAKFISLLASECGSLLNYANIANDLSLTEPTVEKYVSILEASHIIYLLKPYSNNLSKRLIKTPKVYFFDTGLICHLLHWNTIETLRDGAMAGRILENYVITEILKGYYNSGDNNPPLYYYRDKDKKEIDLIIEQEGTLYPIEIKKHADPRKDDTKNFSVLNKFTNTKIGQGAVISFYDKVLHITDNVINVPIAYL